MNTGVRRLPPLVVQRPERIILDTTCLGPVAAHIQVQHELLTNQDLLDKTQVRYLPTCQILQQTLRRLLLRKHCALGFLTVLIGSFGNIALQYQSRRNERALNTLNS